MLRELSSKLLVSNFVRSELRMTTIRLAGVPEQAFIPIQLAQSEGIFSKLGLDVVWRETPEGTGKLLTLVEEGEVDVALTVTDGFIAGKAAGRAVSLCGTYIKSPLVWACSACKDSNLESLEDLNPKTLGHKMRWGVSRMGSGSHTMGVYASKNMSVGADDVEFVIADNFQGLREGSNANNFDAFLWEHFTSKPYWGNETKYIGDVPTPWPAFSFVSGRNLAEGKVSASDIQNLFEGIAQGVKLFVDGGEGTIDKICGEHKHTREDAHIWLSRTSYAIDSPMPMALDKSHYSKSVEIMKDVGLVSKDYDVESLWDNQAAAFT